MNRLERAVAELTGIFRGTSDKHLAHRRCAPILGELADPRTMSAILEQNLPRRELWNARNYPVVALPIASNPYFDLVANCWIPLPGRETTISTKAIHHHGEMLLSTVTVFGPGYEHWTFTPPAAIDPGRALYSMKVIEAKPHPTGHVAFVDAQIAHLPLYPPSLSVTIALWSSSRPTTWRDHVKRVKVLRQNQALLKSVAKRIGLADRLELKFVEFYDFYPIESGFQGMKERQEFQLGPNEDHLHSLFHVIQGTGNSGLARRIRGELGDGGIAARATVEKLLSDLEHDRPIEGRLSEQHMNVPHANFTIAEVERSLSALA
jgi:hypothetical protein